MSLFGALNTAVSGLGAQSAAFGNISDNVANSQTAGFKRIDTSFIDHLTTSTPVQNQPGAVSAVPNYINNIQGAVNQTDNPLALAVSGQGFFAVSKPTGELNGQPTFGIEYQYTRAGDFVLDKNGYLVNSTGQFLNGWLATPGTSTINENAVLPIQVSQAASVNPVATSTVKLAANLPATPLAGTAMPASAGPPAVAASPLTSQVSVYDKLGTAHTVTLNWTKTSSNVWNVQIVSPDGLTSSGSPGTVPAALPAVTDAGSADVTFGTFGAASLAAVPAIGTVTVGAGGTPPVTISAGTQAVVNFTTDFGSGPQTIQLNLGTYGATDGVTQFAGTTYGLKGLSQDGVPPGSYAGVTTQNNGDVVINYNNGQTRTVARVPVVLFNAPDALQRRDGQSFTATVGSGDPLVETVNNNGAGNLVTGAVENSNVDIATEFSQLIVAQQAYSANAKVVTTADTMIQVTINMKT